MLCEKCSKNEATVFYREIVNGKEKKYSLCSDCAAKLEKEGKALIIAPDDCCGVDTLKRTKESLEALYKKGYNDSRAALSFI